MEVWLEWFQYVLVLTVFILWLSVLCQVQSLPLNMGIKGTVSVISNDPNAKIHNGSLEIFDW